MGWLVVADAHPDLQDALRLFGSASDWFDLYKGYELVREGLGGQAAVEAVIGKPTRSRLTQTMTHHLHADKPLSAQSVAFEDAERLVAGLLEASLAKLRRPVEPGAELCLSLARTETAALVVVGEERPPRVLDAIHATWTVEPA